MTNNLVAFLISSYQIIVLTKQEGGFPGGETSIGSEFLLENDELVENFVELGLYPSCRILSSYLHGPVREDRLKITVATVEQPNDCTWS